jgi:hypothetical protein
MKIQGWLDWFREHALPRDTFIEKVTDHVGNVSRTRETKIKVPRRARMDEIDKLLAAAKGVKLDTEIIVPAHAVAAEGATTTIQMNCADCNERCNGSVKTSWLTSQAAGDLVRWQCAKCGLEQFCSITPQ